MTIYQRMAALFEEADIPGFFQEWMATDEYPAIPDTYCTYLVEREGEGIAADDATLAYRFTVWIDLYGREDVAEAERALVRALRAGGFYIPFTRDLDNQRLSDFQYHRRMQVTYYDFDYDPEEEE